MNGESENVSCRLTRALPPDLTHFNIQLIAKIDYKTITKIEHPPTKSRAEQLCALLHLILNNPERCKLFLSPLFSRRNWGTKTKMAWDQLPRAVKRLPPMKILFRAHAFQLLPQNGFSQLSNDCEAEDKSSMWLQFSQSPVCFDMFWRLVCPFTYWTILALLPQVI